jgi:hypothetical protein
LKLKDLKTSFGTAPFIDLSICCKALQNFPNWLLIADFWEKYNVPWGIYGEEQRIGRPIDSLGSSLRDAGCCLRIRVLTQQWLRLFLFLLFFSLDRSVGVGIETRKILGPEHGSWAWVMSTHNFYRNFSNLVLIIWFS